MRKLLVIVGFAAIAAISAGCMSDDSEQSARRPAAMAVREPASFGAVRLSLGDSETTWRSYTWGVSADVVVQKTVDEVGQEMSTLSAGQVEPGTVTLERGLTVDSPQFVELFRKGPLSFRGATLTLLASDGSTVGTYTLSAGVVADLKHRSSEALVLETLTLRFGSAAFQM
jgi:hypothetical protein